MINKKKLWNNLRNELNSFYWSKNVDFCGSVLEVMYTLNCLEAQGIHLFGPSLNKYTKNAILRVSTKEWLQTFAKLTKNNLAILHLCNVIDEIKESCNTKTKKVNNKEGIR